MSFFSQELNDNQKREKTQTNHKHYLVFTIFLQPKKVTAATIPSYKVL